MVNSASPAALPRICFQNLPFAPRLCLPARLHACKDSAMCGVHTHTQAPGEPSNIYIISGSPPRRVIIRGITAANPTYIGTPARLNARAAVSLSASPDLVPSLHIISTPQPPRTSAPGEASPLASLRPCPCSHVLRLLASSSLRILPVSVPACALPRLPRPVVYAKNAPIRCRSVLHRRIYTRTQNCIIAARRGDEVRDLVPRRGRLYYSMMSSMPQHAPPCQPCSVRGGADRRTEANKKPRRASARRGAVMGSCRLQRPELLEA